jgi:subtilisin family serine protease
MALRWMGAVERLIASRRAWRNVAFTLEHLEPLLLLSASPLDATASDWHQQTFALSPLDLAADQQSLPGLQAQDALALGLIRGQQVQTQFGYTGQGYSVAILDTGLDYNNPAFAGRYLGGYDFVDNTTDPMDHQGHGTHVAGIIGSADPNHLGVAPGVDLIALKVLDNSASGTFGNVDRALQWVIAHQQQYHIVAVNMSLGSGNYNTEPFTYLDADLQALKNEGVFTAAAAGNSYYSYGSQPGLAFPAINNLAVSVGAVWDSHYGSVSWANGAKDYTTAPDQITSFTQRNAQLGILAPGAFITSTYLNGTFASMAGTSMATPFVAGSAVLIHQALDADGLGVEANQDEILSLMQRTGVTIVDSALGQDNVLHTGLSFKRLDVLAAIDSISSLSPVSPPPAPTPGTPPAPVQDADDLFVAALYRDVLGRSIEPATAVAWSQAMSAGLTRGQLAAVVFESVEHRGQQVTADYQDLLHRTPSASERDAWVRLMIAGVSETDVAVAFLTSGEYQAAHADNASFVEGLFQDVLGRAVEPGTLSAWTSLLNAGVSRGQLVDAILHSTERDARVVNDDFEQFLGRPAGADALSFASLVANGSLTLDTVAELILASPEFLNRAGGAGGQSLDALGADLDALVQELSTVTSADSPAPHDPLVAPLGHSADGDLVLVRGSLPIESLPASLERYV